ncbi:MAG: hypothetical protein K6E32_11000 [Lachnospiraceae bacterium]|nr:hypothetical protein [Lachnospiraceae bacterium]
MSDELKNKEDENKVEAEERAEAEEKAEIEENTEAEAQTETEDKTESEASEKTEDGEKSESEETSEKPETEDKTGSEGKPESEEKSETEEKTETEEQPGSEEDHAKKVNITSLVAIILGCVVAVAALVVLVIFLLPNNRIKRYMNAADKAYAESDYAKALSNYEKAEKLDETDYKAIHGKLLCMSALGDEKAEKAALEALVKLSERTEAFTDEEKTDCEELYLCAADIFKDYDNNGAAYCAKLDAVYETLDKPGTLSAALSDSCVKYADTLFDTGTEGQTKLDLFVRAYEVSSADFCRVRGAATADILIGDALSRDAFEEARKLLAEYGEKLSLAVDAQTERIDNAESLYNTKNSLMSAVFEAMKAYYDENAGTFSEEKARAAEGLNFGMLAHDWIAMQTIDGSDDAQLLSSNCEDGKLLWAPEGFTQGYTGLACGLYTYGDEVIDENGNKLVSYYFFFGNYKDGVRDGYGISFIKIKDTSYYAFEGFYKDDKPEGFGVYYKKNTYAYTSLAEYTEVCFGNYIGGFVDGTATVRVSLNEKPGTYYEGTFEASMGEPKEAPMATEEYEVLNEIPEGYTLIGVLPNITDGYDNFMIYRNPVGAKKGAIGYE